MVTSESGLNASSQNLGHAMTRPSHSGLGRFIRQVHGSIWRSFFVGNGVALKIFLKLIQENKIVRSNNIP